MESKNLEVIKKYENLSSYEILNEISNVKNLIKVNGDKFRIINNLGYENKEEFKENLNEVLPSVEEIKQFLSMAREYIIENENDFAHLYSLNWIDSSDQNERDFFYGLILKRNGMTGAVRRMVYKRLFQEKEELNILLKHLNLKIRLICEEEFKKAKNY